MNANRMNFNYTVATWAAMILSAPCFIVDLVVHHHVGAMLFLALEAAFVAFLLMSDYPAMPHKNLAFCLTLTEDELRAFRKHHIWLKFPGAAGMYSAAMAALGLLGLVWAAAAFFDHGPVVGSLLVALCLFEIGYQARIAPMPATLVLMDKGDASAKRRHTVLVAVHTKLQAAAAAGAAATKVAAAGEAVRSLNAAGPQPGRSD